MDQVLDMQAEVKTYEDLATEYRQLRAAKALELKQRYPGLGAMSAKHSAEIELEDEGIFPPWTTIDPIEQQWNFERQQHEADLHSASMRR